VVDLAGHGGTKRALVLLVSLDTGLLALKKTKAGQKTLQSKGMRQ
jgi:hypothetical protein